MCLPRCADGVPSAVVDDKLLAWGGVHTLHIDFVIPLTQDLKRTLEQKMKNRLWKTNWDMDFLIKY